MAALLPILFGLWVYHLLGRLLDEAPGDRPASNPPQLYTVYNVTVVMEQPQRDNGDPIETVGRKVG